MNALSNNTNSQINALTLNAKSTNDQITQLTNLINTLAKSGSNNGSSNGTPPVTPVSENPPILPTPGTKVSLAQAYALLTQDIPIPTEEGPKAPEFSNTSNWDPYVYHGIDNDYDSDDESSTKSPPYVIPNRNSITLPIGCPEIRVLKVKENTDLLNLEVSVQIRISPSLSTFRNPKLLLIISLVEDTSISII